MGGHIAQVVVKKELEKEDQVVTKDKDDLRCPISGCPEDFVRSVHLKRHLTGVHNIQNPLNVFEADGTSQDHLPENEKVQVKTEAEKVPPLKIKLSHSENAVDCNEVNEDINLSAMDKNDAIVEEEETAPVGVII